MEPKYEGTRDNPIQIDEPYLSGKRKYNRRRILSGDRDSDNDDDAVNDWGEELILMMMMTEITDMMKRIGGGYWGFITRKIMFAL